VTPGIFFTNGINYITEKPLTKSSSICSLTEPFIKHRNW